MEDENETRVWDKALLENTMAKNLLSETQLMTETETKEGKGEKNNLATGMNKNVRKDQWSPEDNKSAMTLSEPLVAKRRRGRPKKCCEDGVVSSPLPLSVAQLEEISATKKRGRGRPKGSGRKPDFLESLGCLGLTLAGGLTPHVIRVLQGEDVVRKIMTLDQSGPRSVCILSAQGTVSTAIIHQPSGVFYKYEGRFQIINLTGTYVVAGEDGSQRKIGKLNVSLCRADGNIFGGASVASLIAAEDDVELVLGSFKQDSRIQQKLWPAEAEDSMIGPDDLAGAPVITVPIVAEETLFPGAGSSSNVILDAVPISYFLPSSPQAFVDQNIFDNIPDQNSFAEDSTVFPNI